MNTTSGSFTAPSDGIYLFEVDGHKCAGNIVADIHIHHNGVLKHRILQSDDMPTDTSKPQSTQITSFWTLDMKVGDQIILVNQEANSLYIKGDPAYYTFSFTGIALN